MRLATAVLAVAALALAGCSDPVEGNPAPGSGVRVDGSSSVEVTPPPSAPKVAEPLAAEPYAADACRAISAERARGLGLAVPGADASTAVSAGCVWATVDRQFSIAVNYLTTLSAGLSEVYAQHWKNPQSFKYFEPAVVAGYPALYAGKVDERKRGMCELDIGVTDTLYLQVVVNHIPRGREVCELAARAGEAVIATMKEGE